MQIGATLFYAIARHCFGFPSLLVSWRYLSIASQIVAGLFHRLSLSRARSLDDLVIETPLAGVSPLTEAAILTVFHPFLDKLFVAVHHAKDFKLQNSTGRNAL